MKEEGKAFAVAGSVTDESHVQETVRRTVQQFGRLDILVNNAGVGDFGKRLHEIDDATWAQVLDVNLTGVFRMTRAVSAADVERRGRERSSISPPSRAWSDFPHCRPMLPPRGRLMP